MRTLIDEDEVLDTARGVAPHFDDGHVAHVLTLRRSARNSSMEYGVPNAWYTPSGANTSIQRVCSLRLANDM